MKMQQVSNQEMLEMILKLQARVDKLQEDFKDDQLSDDDIAALKKAEEEYKNGETISLEELEKELGMN